MPTESKQPPRDPIHEDGKMREDVAVPPASEDKVLEETARMAREGREKLENDPKERGTATTDTDTPRE